MLVLVLSVGWLAFTDADLLVLAIPVIAATMLGAPFLFAMKILHPSRTYPLITPADLGIERWEEVQFSSLDGVELRGWLIPPQPSNDGATLLFVHGLGNNRGELLGEAAALIAKGYGAMLFDLRNHGTSGGNISTLGYRETEDVCGAVNYLLSRPEVDPQRIGLVGHSMGGVAALRAAARLPQVKAIIAESAFTSLEDNIAQGVVAMTGLPPFPFAPFMIWLGERITGLRINQIRPIDDVALIAPRPVLFVHGEQDTVVEVSNSVRLFEASHQPKGLYVISQAGHTALASADPQEFYRRICGFFDWSLHGIERRSQSRFNSA